MFYEITYVYEGKKATTVVQPSEGWESRFYQKCLAVIDSLTLAGAQIVDTCMHTGR